MSKEQSDEGSGRNRENLISRTYSKHPYASEDMKREVRNGCRRGDRTVASYLSKEKGSSDFSRG